MCMRMGLHGVPLDDITLDAMSMEERSFWLSFMELANQEIDRAESRPIKPSSALQEKYTKAVKSYDGRKYCQVNGLESIFSFA